MAKVIAIHRTYEKSKAFNRDIVIYRSGDTPLRGLTQINEWISTLNQDYIIRSTYVNAADGLLLSIVNTGAKIVYANWNDTGIEKGTDNQEKVEKFALLDEKLFFSFTPRKDLCELRNILNIHRAVEDERKRAVQRVKAVARNQGMVEEEDYDDVMLHYLKIASRIEVTLEDGKTVDWLTDIRNKMAAMAKEIPECRLWNEIAHIKDGWITATTVAALSGGMFRFPRASSWLHYCGDHVDADGKAPKAKAGIPSSWNSRLRSSLWAFTVSVIKNMDNPWRSFYDKAREYELATHDTGDSSASPVPKLPCSCKYKEGHAGARARRKMRKEILKRFWVACNEQKYIEGHKPEPPETKTEEPPETKAKSTSAGD